MGRSVHVEPSSEGWAVREGERRLASFRSKSEALDASRTLAQEHGGEQVVHDPAGRVVERNTYGRDPFPPQDDSDPSDTRATL